MSVKVTGWVWDQPFTSSEKLVALKLADHADHDGDNVYPSVAEIARKTDLSERQVKRYLKDFLARGILEIRDHEHGGRGKTRVYRFTFHFAPKGATDDTVSAAESVTPTSPFPATNRDTGDTVSSPKRVTSDARKGDTHDMKRVTSDARKGDIHARANQNRPEASPEPSGNRERGGRPSVPHELPPDFTVTDAMYDWAADEFGLLQAEVDRETAMFRDHFTARGDRRADWVAEWRKWIRRSDRFRMGDPVPPPRTRRDPPARPPDDMSDEEAEQFYLRDVYERKGT